MSCSREDEFARSNDWEKETLPNEPHLIAPTLLVDFAALPAGWNFVSFKVGPFGDLTLLISEDLNPRPEAGTWSDMLWFLDTARRGRDRAIHLVAGRDIDPSASLDLPASTEPDFSVNWLSNDRWL